MKQTIRNLRKQNKMTQKELADLVGTSQAAISSYEKGTRRLGLETAQKIAIALEVSLDELWHGIDVENTELVDTSKRGGKEQIYG